MSIVNYVDGLDFLFREAVPHRFDFGIIACLCMWRVLHNLALIGAVVIEWPPPCPFHFGAVTGQTMEVAL